MVCNQEYRCGFFLRGRYHISLKLGTPVETKGPRCELQDRMDYPGQKKKHAPQFKRNVISASQKKYFILLKKASLLNLKKRNFRILPPTD